MTVRADALDLRAHAVQHVAQVLHVRLGGGVADARRALGQHGGHDRVFGRGHAGLVQQDVRPAQVWRRHAERAIELDLCAEAPQREDVRIEAAAPDHVPAGWGHLHRARACQQRTGEHDRGARLLA